LVERGVSLVNLPDFKPSDLEGKNILVRDRDKVKVRVREYPLKSCQYYVIYTPLTDLLVEKNTDIFFGQPT
jgi:hypothetical protein